MVYTGATVAMAKLGVGFSPAHLGASCSLCSASTARRSRSRGMVSTGCSNSPLHHEHGTKTLSPPSAPGGVAAAGGNAGPAEPGSPSSEPPLENCKPGWVRLRIPPEPGNAGGPAVPTVVDRERANIRTQESNGCQETSHRLPTPDDFLVPHLVRVSAATPERSSSRYPAVQRQRVQPLERFPRSRGPLQTFEFLGFSQDCFSAPRAFCRRTRVSRTCHLAKIARHRHR